VLTSEGKTRSLRTSFTSGAWARQAAGVLSGRHFIVEVLYYAYGC